MTKCPYPTSPKKCERNGKFKYCCCDCPDWHDCEEHCLNTPEKCGRDKNSMILKPSRKGNTTEEEDGTELYEEPANCSTCKFFGESQFRDLWECHITRKPFDNNKPGKICEMYIKGETK